MRLKHDQCPSTYQSFCGPAAVALITGETAEEAARCFNLFSGRPLDQQVKGTYQREVERVLEFFDFKMVFVERPKGTWGTRENMWGEVNDVYHHKTVTQILKILLPGETYFVGTGRHWFVIKDGRAYDNSRPEGWDISKPNRPYRRGRVRCLARMEKIPQ